MKKVLTLGMEEPSTEKSEDGWSLICLSTSKMEPATVDTSSTLMMRKMYSLFRVDIWIQDSASLPCSRDAHSSRLGSSSMNSLSASVGRKPCSQERSAGLRSTTPSSHGNVSVSFSSVVIAEMAATGAAQKKISATRKAAARPSLPALEARVAPMFGQYTSRGPGASATRQEALSSCSSVCTAACASALLRNVTNPHVDGTSSCARVSATRPFSSRSRVA
mmetsp:Transcript_14388/g.45917  ORF Transcript_14388/g.45917 Transcript_14388/m.45917 type:complete len:220 (+) Transcript_14388:564-1223(+)